MQSCFVLISKEDVPFYLQAGAFYKALSSDDTEKMSIPSDALKHTLKVTSIEDLVHLLKSLRFWAVEEPVIEVFEYVLAHTSNDIYNVITEFEVNFPYLYFLRSVKLRVEDHSNGWTVMDIALREGFFDVVKMLHRRGDTFSAKSVDHAVWGGNVDCLKFVIHEGGMKATDTAFLTAYTHGRLSCLQYLHDHRTGPLDPYACIGAANTNQLESLKFLFAQGYPLNSGNYDTAAEKGYLGCVQFLHEKGAPWGVHVSASAACGGQLEVLHYLHAHNCPWDDRAMRLAVHGGYLSCVKFLHEKGCPWDTSICDAAASRGQLQCLAYLHQQGCPWDEHTCNEAVRYNHLDCLLYAHSNGCPWGTDAYESALRNKNDRIMQYLHSHTIEGVQGFQEYIDEHDAKAAAPPVVYGSIGSTYGTTALSSGGDWTTGNSGNFGGTSGFGTPQSGGGWAASNTSSFGGGYF